MQVDCTKCSQPIRLTDVIQSNNGHLSHVDCKRPHVLTPEERALVFVYCSGHVVARCHGRGIYGPPENGEFYPAEALAGTGTVGARAVKCITPEWLVHFHTGYELDETDWSDVSALCERFGIPIPDEYARFQRDSGPR